MNRKPACTALAALALATGVSCQEEPPIAAHERKPTPSPTPVDPGSPGGPQLCSQGIWNATVETMGPGAPKGTWKGTERNRIVGGKWLVSDFKGEVMGMPYEGHGQWGFDGTKRKYVGTWTDNLSNGFSMAQGDYDPEAQTLTTLLQGAAVGRRATMECKGPDQRIFTVFTRTPDGKETPALRILYERVKEAWAPSP
jgi:hypothetical protein